MPDQYHKATMVKFEMLERLKQYFLRQNPLFWALPIQALLFFWNLDLLDPWGDEWFTLTTVTLPIHQIASVVSNNIHPPLYYFLLHYWVQLPTAGSLIAKMRAMSALWTLISTVTVYRFWLQREERKFQVVFLFLWIFSPCLLLHGRMARSYSMQLAIAPVVIWAAIQWLELPLNRKRLFACSLSAVALLYTHYLSGLAVITAIFILMLFKRRSSQAFYFAMIVGILYAPWLPTLVGALGKWKSAGMEQEGNIVIDQLVRLAYLFVSFNFGETFSAISLFFLVILIPIVIYGIWRSLRLGPQWLLLVSIAALLAWLGVSRWSQFPFMPTGLMFTFPFFLLLITRHLPTPALAAFIILYISADFAYFSKSGYLIKPYAAPFSAMASVICSGSGDQPALLAIDPYGTFYEPMLDRLPQNIRVITLDDEFSANLVREAARDQTAGPKVIWLWRHTRDVSPSSFVTKLETDLLSLNGLHATERSSAKEVKGHYFLPYSQLERWIRRVLRGPGQANFYYSLLQVR